MIALLVTVLIGLLGTVAIMLVVRSEESVSFLS